MVLQETAEGENCRPEEKRIHLVAAGGHGTRSQKNFLMVGGSGEMWKWVARGSGPLPLLRLFQNLGGWVELGCSSYSPVLRQPLTQLLVGMEDMGTEGSSMGLRIYGF